LIRRTVDGVVPWPALGRYRVLPATVRSNKEARAAGGQGTLFQ
jgi:hypothetical protein